MTREQYWEDMVAKFQATTLSQAAFCLEQDIKCHNFRYWLAKLTPSTQTPSFIKLAPFSKAIPVLVNASISSAIVELSCIRPYKKYVIPIFSGKRLKTKHCLSHSIILYFQQIGGRVCFVSA
ncbi:MAG: hypothetical protein RL060_618 [Bacteroidota bacterium]|jgi:hypothetical protein